jgi:hypothetical protein
MFLYCFVLRVAAIFAVCVLFSASLSGAFALDGTQRVEIKNPRLVNSFDEQISQNVNVNQQVQISADVVNKQDIGQDFVYIVQILDSNGINHKITWFSGVDPLGVGALKPHQSLSAAISWTPNRPGSYVANMYVWDSIKDANALAVPISYKITVS